MNDNDLENEINILNTKISILKEEVKSNNSLSFILSKLSLLKSIKIKLKIVDFLTLLIAKEIPFNLLSQKMFEGIPDDILSFRPLLWKISLNYLSLKPNEWESILNKNRTLYESYKKKYSINLSPLSKTRTKKIKDNPLSNNKNSLWEKYFEDKDLYESIKKDILRTKSNMNFVSMPSVGNKEIPSKDIIIKTAIDLKDNTGLNQKKLNNTSFETNAEVMNRILFIYAKIHKDVSYVQGMNDLLAPIYYCFSIDNNPENINHVEHDSYITFEKLMDVIKIIFIRTKDNEPGGVNFRLREIGNFLKIIDYELFLHLKRNKVKIEFYAFRWMTLFFTQDFEMPDIMRLWDSILSDPEIFEFLHLLVLAPIIIKRNEIMKENMSGIMMMIQNLEDITVYDLIQTTIKIRNELNKKTRW